VFFPNREVTSTHCKTDHDQEGHGNKDGSPQPSSRPVHEGEPRTLRVLCVVRAHGGLRWFLGGHDSAPDSGIVALWHHWGACNSVRAEPEESRSPLGIEKPRANLCSLVHMGRRSLSCHGCNLRKTSAPTRVNLQRWLGDSPTHTNSRWSKQIASGSALSWPAILLSPNVSSVRSLSSRARSIASGQTST
jgi:hypothetical protein